MLKKIIFNFKHYFFTLTGNGKWIEILPYNGLLTLVTQESARKMMGAIG
jgi:hypothetical protein